MDYYKIINGGERVKLTQDEIDEISDFEPLEQEEKSELDELKAQVGEISKVISALKKSELLSGIFRKLG